MEFELPVDSEGQSLFIESVADGFGALGGAEPLIDGTRGLNGSPVDPPVEKQHDEHGQVERT